MFWQFLWFSSSELFRPSYSVDTDLFRQVVTCFSNFLTSKPVSLAKWEFSRFYPTYILTNLLVCCCVLTSYQSFETLLSHLYTQPSGAVPGKTGKTVVLPQFPKKRGEGKVSICNSFDWHSLFSLAKLTISAFFFASFENLNRYVTFFFLFKLFKWSSQIAPIRLPSANDWLL